MLTRRGRLLRTIAVALALVVLIILVSLLLRSCGGGAVSPEPSPVVPAASDGGQSAAPSATPSESATDAAATQPSQAEQPKADAPPTDASGMVHSGTAGDGTWTVAPVVSAPPATANVRRYALQIENGSGIDPQAAATEVAGILGDPRGWSGAEGVSFEQVADPAEANVVLHLATPPTTDRMCRPANTQGTWSCRQGRSVILNTDRWLYMTPTYTDLAAYRTYQVNHEVGHYLGHGHVSCPGSDRAAPVMLQQGMDLGGCVPNPWPTLDGS